MDIPAQDQRPTADAELLLEDLTRLNNELVSVQRELARKNAELERLNAQKNRFVGIVAHDLRSPLSNIIMYSELLIHEGSRTLDPEQSDMLSMIQQSGENMLALVNDLLDVSSIEAGKLELSLKTVDLAALVQRNVSLNRARAHQKNITLQAHGTDSPCPAVADPGKVEQVLDNLISNAVKYSPPQAVVDVYLRRGEDAVSLVVSDTGQGIPVEEQDRLFRPFGRTSVRGTAGEQSTGLGLLIVKKIAEAHGGSVGVESEAGRGATFTVTLPRRS